MRVNATMADFDANEAASKKVEAALSQIQPIRDLAKNWDIDIASCLEEYLGELVNQFGDLAKNALAGEEKKDDDVENAPPNFAQAALLLQNSSHVYSRKVEYLHSLVYTALNELINSSGQKQKEQAGSKLDPDIDEFNAFDPENEFLLLDDVLPTDETIAGDKINLVEKDDDNDLLFGRDESASFTPVSQAGVNGIGDTTRLSLGGLSVTRLDRSAVLQNIPSTATATRALMGSIFNEGSDTAGGNLRLLSGRCDVAENGVLLMPGSSILGNNNQNKDERKSLETSARNLSLDPNIINEDEPMMNNTNDGVDYDDGHDDGAGFDFGGDNESTVSDRETPASPTGIVPTEPAPKPKKVQIKENPWALLDPHDVGTSKPKPLRIGKTYVLPSGLTDPPSSSVTGARTKKSGPLKTFQQQKKRARSNAGIACETFQATMAMESRKRELLGLSVDNSVLSHDDEHDEEHLVPAAPTSIPLKGLVFGEEFAYAAKAHAKRKAAERRERRKFLAENPSAVPPEEVDNLMGFGDDNDDAGGFDFGGADDDSFGGGDFDGDNDGIENDRVGNAGITSINDAFGPVDIDDRDGSNDDARTFEALCRAHIKAFARGAEKYAAETKLTKRVGTWQSKLAPILEEEERRGEFNIRVYGDRIISNLKTEIDRRGRESKVNTLGGSSCPPKETNVVDFRSITKNCEQYEVCRLFLSSLMLTNSGNVMVSQDDKSGDCLNVELLNADVDSPMESYLAPSALEQDTVAVQ